ncbi:C-C chemokine receptor type 6 [Discoglossus pictus]
MANISMTDTDDYYPTESIDYDLESLMCSMEDVRRFVKMLAPVTYLLIFVFGLVGNILVVLTFSCYKRTKSMTDVYLLNMAIADILFILTLPFWAVYRHEINWIFSDFMCKLISSIYVINFNCSMLLLACVGIDRYIAIVQVTKSFRFRATAIAYKKCICLFVWFITICLSSLTFSFNEAYKPDGNPLLCEARYRDNTTAITWKLTVLAVQFSTGFFIPFLIMIFCYSFIIKALLQTQNSQRHKAIRVVVAVVAVFLICQVPYNVLLLIKAGYIGKNAKCSDMIKIAYATFFTETIAFYHCCLNPVIYAFVGVKFRNYFVKIVQDLWCIGKQYISANRTSRASSEVYNSRRTSEVYATGGGSSFTM